MYESGQKKLHPQCQDLGMNERADIGRCHRDIHLEGTPLYYDLRRHLDAVLRQVFEDVP